MGYLDDGATIWKEHSMDAATKIAALNKLEGMYSEATSYIDSVSHSSLYYSEAECSSRYFTSQTDGTGSGLICATLDGLTADEIINSSTPSGGIAIWPGSEVAIPAGWNLCNGTNGTPNLRNRFVIAAGGSYTKGWTGGSNVATPYASSVTIGTHVITGTELPEHTHGYVDFYGAGISGTNWGGQGPLSDSGRWTELGTSTPHGHPGSSFSGSETDVRPAFFALCYIMKS